jgi:hypothetical protein
MNNVVMVMIVAVLCGVLATGALKYGNSVALDGMASLNAKYRGKCVSLSDGKHGTILGIKAKSIRLSVLDGKGQEQVIDVGRVPLDQYVAPCQR